ncbi:MAG: lysylphosphatidylglycerol synthase domain-containing protein [Pseudomonadota bacterium]
MTTLIKSLTQSKFIFTLLGVAALGYLVYQYGPGSLVRDLRTAGWFSLVLVLTFIPTLICYAWAWLLCSDLPGPGGKALVNGKRTLIFTKMMAISIAWNNLTPFLKVGGEPAKVLMLKKYLGFSKALESTIIYNLIHALATLGSFILAASLLLLFYPLNPGIRFLAIIIILAGIAIGFFALFLPYLWHKWMIKTSLSLPITHKNGWRKFNWIRRTLIGLIWTVRKTFFYYKKHPYRLGVAFGLEIFARFIEGLTFYCAFYLLNHPISLVASALLDVGRTLVDTLFFFIPYQVGSREQGVLFFLENILGYSSAGYLTATFLYRFVEIVWVVIGYAFWTRSKRATTSLI